MKNKLIQYLFISMIIFINLMQNTFALTESDFAYSADLAIEKGKPYYELDIPEVVYKGVSRTDLGDIRVLNGAGQIVPHGLREIEPVKTNSTLAESLPFFPLYQKEGETSSDLHLNIQRSDSGEIIEIKSLGATQRPTEKLTGYLVDLSEWKKPVDKIKISWNISKGVSFIRKLDISVSDNLSEWKALSSEKALVNLSYQNHQLIEDSFPLSLGRSRYLRIIFADNKPGLIFNKIEVINNLSSQQQKRNWQQVSVDRSDNAGEYLFQYQLKTLLRKLRVYLPENNTVVNVKVMSRANKDKTWQYRGSALLYRLSVDGINLQQSEIQLRASTDMHWKLQVDQQGGGIGTSLPKLELAWKPQQLVFVARGEPPYKLVWGSARVKPVTQNARNILAGVSQGNHINMVARAHWLADSVQSVNLKSLEAETTPLNWRQGLLWFILIIAALSLVWMAVRLMGKMSE